MTDKGHLAGGGLSPLSTPHTLPQGSWECGPTVTASGSLPGHSGDEALPAPRPLPHWHAGTTDRRVSASPLGAPRSLPPAVLGSQGSRGTARVCQGTEPAGGGGCFYVPYPGPRWFKTPGLHTGLRDAFQTAQNHTACQWQSQDSNPDLPQAVPYSPGSSRAALASPEAAGSG